MPHPNLFLIGAPKGGTTFIYDLLRNSSDVFAPEHKEPAYYLIYGQKIRYKQRFVAPYPDLSKKEEYLKLYDGADRRYIIDASTHYLSSPETAPRIHAACPEARVIAVLREPVSRAYSHYLMGVRDGFVTEDFPEALAQEKREMADPDTLWIEHYRFIRRSLYLDGLKAFHAHFGSNMRVYLFEDVQTDADFIIRDISEFLDLDAAELSRKIDDAERNQFAVDRFSVVTRVLQRYRESGLRPLINRLTPTSLRDKLRIGYERLRLKKAEKPPLDETAKQILLQALGNDYEASLEFARNTNILRASHGGST